MIRALDEPAGAPASERVADDEKETGCPEAQCGQVGEESRERGTSERGLRPSVGRSRVSEARANAGSDHRSGGVA
jgi:hypothetical protein